MVIVVVRSDQWCRGDQMCRGQIRGVELVRGLGGIRGVGVIRCVGDIYYHPKLSHSSVIISLNSLYTLYSHRYKRE